MNPRAPVVSVVTPFYNTAPYLAECIESVLAQSFRDFEYILVDNQSTDGSAAIAERYAVQDSRIRVIRNREFLSQVRNYNHALRQIAPGTRYCKVVQADDWIFPRCLEEMVGVADAHPSAGMVGAYTLIERNLYLDGLPYPSALVPGREVCRRFLLDGLYVWGSPTATLLRADLVRSRNPFYDERSPLEDVDICFELLGQADFGFVHQVLTFTRRENESLMSGLKHFGVLVLARMMASEKYGPLFLTPDEQRRRRREVSREYYALLGEAIVRRRPPQFWELHRKGLEAAGTRLSEWRAGWHALVCLARLILNPWDTATRLWRRARPPA